jgi:uncharacterized protein
VLTRHRGRILQYPVLKDALRLAIYFVSVILIGALIAPILFWSAQLLASDGVLPFLGTFDFELFFHRALLVSAVLLLWPFLCWIRVRRLEDLGIKANPQRWRDFGAGFFLALLPLVGCALILLALHVYSLRQTISWTPLGRITLAAAVVPPVEETFFRGLVLGALLRSGRKYLAIFLTSALFSVVHFLKAPKGTSPVVTFASGFQSIAHAFSQFTEPMLILAGFATLFLVGWILADVRIGTASLWLPVGLHAGWILGSGVFGKIARREMLLPPWLGKNLLVGLIPLAVLFLTWIIVRIWLSRENRV